MTIPGVPNQNLINPTRITTRPVRGPGFWKAIVLDALSVASAALFGYVYYRYLTAGLSPWFLLSGLVTFGAFSVIQVFLALSVTRRAVTILLETAALTVFFVKYDAWEILLLAAALTFIALFYGYARSRSEVKNSVEDQFFRGARHMLGALATAALLFMILAYAPQAEGQGIFVPRQSFQTFFAWSSGFLNGLYPNIPFNGTFSEFSQGLARTELDNNPAFKAMTATEQAAVVNQASTQLATEVTGATGVAPAPSDLVSTVAYNYIVAMLSGWRNQFQTSFVVVWVITLFIVLRTFGIVFVWVAQIVAVIVYEAFLSAGFMRVTEIAHTKEVVEY